MVPSCVFVKAPRDFELEAYDPKIQEKELPCFNLTRDYTIEQEGFED